jgi:hypothetical protein
MRARLFVYCGMEITWRYIESVKQTVFKDENKFKNCRIRYYRAHPSERPPSCCHPSGKQPKQPLQSLVAAPDCTSKSRARISLASTLVVYNSSLGLASWWDLDPREFISICYGPLLREAHNELRTSSFIFHSPDLPPCFGTFSITRLFTGYFAPSWSAVSSLSILNTYLLIFLFSCCIGLSSTSPDNHLTHINNITGQLTSSLCNKEISF